MNFKYCPNCKTKIKMSNRLIDCTNCGFHLYINPAPTNGLILENEKGEILLVKRKVPPKKGYWDVPGGFIDFGETLEQSLKRETREELGINIFDLKYFSSTADRYPYKNINYHTLCFLMTAKTSDTKKIFARDDIDGYKFFTKSNFPFDRIAFPQLKTVFKKYLSAAKKSPSGVEKRQNGQK